MTYDAGKSVGSWDLNTTRGDAAIARSIQLLKTFELTQQRAFAVRPPPTPQPPPAPRPTASRQPTEEEIKYQNALARTAEAEAKRINATNRRAQVDQQAATAQAQQALIEQRRQTEAAKTAAADDKAAVAALRRRQAEDRAARTGGGGLGPALPRTFAGFTPQGLVQAAGAFGLASIGPQLVGQTIAAGAEAAKNALALDRTLKLTRELTGTQAAYNDVLKAAKTQQELYGGSVQENIQGIQGLVVTARSTGAELNTLINLAQRLAVLDPAQGAEGARVALSEVLSGDPRSLARRYEIPLSALEKIKDESVPVSERLAILDQYLNKIGITSATVTSVVSEQARTFNRLGAELSTLATTAGQGFANIFERPAEGLSRLVGLINGNPEAIAKLQALISGKGTIDQTDVQNVVEQQARDRAGKTISDAGQAFRPEALGDGGAEKLQNLQKVLTELNLTSDEAGQRGAELVRLFAEQADGGDQVGLTYDQLIFRLGLLNDQGNRGRDIEAGRIQTAQQLAAAEGKATLELTSSLQAKMRATAESQRLADIETTLANIGGAVKAGLLTAAEGATLLANQFGFAAFQARDLVDAAAAAANTGRKGADGSGAVGIISGFQQATQAAKDLQAAQERGILQNGTYAAKLGLLNRQLKDLVPGTAAYVDKQNEIIALQRSQATSGGKGLSGLDRTDIELAGDLQAQLDEVNRQLEKGNLTQLQRNQLLVKQQDLEEKISAEQDKRARAAVDAELGRVRDAEARLKEQREAAGLERALQSGRLNARETEAAQLRLREIGLEQQKRALDIQRDAKTAGDTAAAAPSPGPQAPPAPTPPARPAGGATAPLPLPNIPTLPPTVAPVVNLSLTIALDPVTGRASVVNAAPGLNLVDILTRASQARG